MKIPYTVSNCISPAEIRLAREKLALSQAEFGKLIGCSRATVERWENGNEDIKGAAAFAMNLINAQENPRARFIAPERKTPLRLWYLYRNTICTMMDVDDTKQSVTIRNYVSNVMFTAFGRNTEPTYSDYQEFLKSRCFPEERDKLKLVLKDLNLPFYDPLMIIEKTEGKMAEDDFRVIVER